MEEELLTIKTKLIDLDQIFLDLHLQHSAMRNQQQLESSIEIEFSSSNKFRGSKIDFPRFNGDDPTRWMYRGKKTSF